MVLNRKKSIHFQVPGPEFLSLKGRQGGRLSQYALSVRLPLKCGMHSLIPN